MNNIRSFEVDHNKLQPGMYVSKIDNHNITTYDMRTRVPNGGDYMDDITMHSVEHIFTMFVRGSEIKDDIIYVGPMGCQTGFYMLVKDADDARVLEAVKQALESVMKYEGNMPGGTEVECGNFRTLYVSAAKRECARYYNIIKNKTAKDMQY